MKITEEEYSFEEFTGAFGDTERAIFGVVFKEHKDLFTMLKEYFLAHCVAANLKYLDLLQIVWRM